jgi:hypothetical protein
MRHLLSIAFIFLFIKNIHSIRVFGSLCTTDVEVSGLPSLDGNDEFEIDLYETKFLPDDTILCKKKESYYFYLNRLYI